MGKETLTEEEAALYDRQIRLWGVESQKCLKEARILVVHLSGLAAEVIKNLTLSGVKSITIIDDAKMQVTDRMANFFLAECELGQNRAEGAKYAIQNLNSNVEINIDTDDIANKPAGFFWDFDVVCAFDCSLDLLIKLDKICKDRSIVFYCADTWGFFGYIFLDMKDLDCTVKNDTSDTKNKVPDKTHHLKFCTLEKFVDAKVGAGLKKRLNPVIVLFHIMHSFRKQRDRYPSPLSRSKDYEQLLEIRNSEEKRLGCDKQIVTDSMLEDVFGENSAVCSSVGGTMANEVIRGIANNGIPINNVYLFSGLEYIGMVEKICCE